MVRGVQYLLGVIGRLAVRSKLYVTQADGSGDVAVKASSADGYLGTRTYNNTETVPINDVENVAIAAFSPSVGQIFGLQTDATRGLCVGMRKHDDNLVTLITYAQYVAGFASNPVDTETARNVWIRLGIAVAATPAKVRIEGLLSGASWGTIKYFNGGNVVVANTSYLLDVKEPPNRIRIYIEAPVDMFISSDSKIYF